MRANSQSPYLAVQPLCFLWRPPTRRGRPGSRQPPPPDSCQSAQTICLNWVLRTMERQCKHRPSLDCLGLLQDKLRGLVCLRSREDVWRDGGHLYGSIHIADVSELNEVPRPEISVLKCKASSYRRRVPVR